MNSADQGVFPMDTAFKRRWDFTYLGIDDSEAGIVGKKVILGQGEYRRVVEWNALRKAINDELLTYKGRPWMRKDNMIYYGSMADSHIVMLQGLETKKVQDADIATRVSVQLQLTDPTAKSRDRIVKKSEKNGFYTALDVGCVWLERALAGK